MKRVVEVNTAVSEFSYVKKSANEDKGERKKDRKKYYSQPFSVRKSHAT